MGVCIHLHKTPNFPLVKLAPTNSCIWEEAHNILQLFEQIETIPSCLSLWEMYIQHFMIYQVDPKMDRYEHQFTAEQAWMKSLTCLQFNVLFQGEPLYYEHKTIYLRKQNTSCHVCRYGVCGVLRRWLGGWGRDTLGLKRPLGFNYVVVGDSSWLRLNPRGRSHAWNCYFLIEFMSNTYQLLS